MGKEALRLSTVLAATPQVIYRAWFEGTQHAAFTKQPAKIDGNIGSKFSLRDGKITGRNMALEFGRRVLQSWRSSDFPKAAPDSRLEIVFESVGAGTRMTVMHAELPQGFAEPLRAFWLESYFAPMTDYFGRFATILANTPPSQAVLPLDDEDDEPAPAPVERTSKLSGKSKARAKARAAREAREGAKALEEAETEARRSGRSVADVATRSAAQSKRAPPSRVANERSPSPAQPTPAKKVTLRFPKDAENPVQPKKAAPKRPAAKKAVKVKTKKTAPKKAAPKKAAPKRSAPAKAHTKKPASRAKAAPKKTPKKKR